MKLEEGMYVRTKDGYIDKIILVEYAEERKRNYPNHPSKNHWRDKILLPKVGYWRTTSNIIKASYNIIDLIEEGDILYLEENDDIACMYFRDVYLVKNEDNLLNIKNDIKTKKCKLLSIITKEQFVSMQYEVK